MKAVRLECNILKYYVLAMIGFMFLKDIQRKYQVNNGVWEKKSVSGEKSVLETSGKIKGITKQNRITKLENT